MRQAQPPAPMAARRSQRRRGRRGEPGTALLAPLVLSLGLALACLGLLLVVVSLGSWATLSAQVRPSAYPFLGILGAESAEKQMRACGQRARGSEKGWRMRCQEKDRVTLPPSQQEPSQEELTAEDRREPPVSRCGCCVRDASMEKCV